ncbi:MAG: nucleotidyltransferase domain-containing protein [Chitinophagales bacterium]
MFQKIQTALQKIEQTYKVKILYACESGSRAWGFPSPDSDYDVRFIYLHPMDWYLSINERTNHITLPLDADNLDIVGWDIRKVLNLMQKSNASIFAWMLSPIVYHNQNGFVEKLRELAPQYFAPRAAIHHYLGLTRKIVQTELQRDTVNIKKYFYVLRPLLCAKWIAEKHEAPPMMFQEMLPLLQGNREMLEVIEDLLQRKERALEGEYIEQVPLIHQFAERELAHLHQIAKELPKTQPDNTPLNEWFRTLLKE